MVELRQSSIGPRATIVQGSSLMWCGIFILTYHGMYLVHTLRALPHVHGLFTKGSHSGPQKVMIDPRLGDCALSNYPPHHRLFCSLFLKRALRVALEELVVPTHGCTPLKRLGNLDYEIAYKKYCWDCQKVRARVSFCKSHNFHVRLLGAGQGSCKSEAAYARGTCGECGSL